jgi:hypothetical protein
MSISADASKVSPTEFIDRVFGTTPESRAADRQRDIARCIRAIERGDVYGFPPVLVAECRKLMELTAQVERELRFTIDQQRAA